MERGHAEALLPMVDRVASKVEGSFATLDRVAVTIGPGSYTGLRVGIAAARAIGLAAAIPVVGVSTLSALLAPLMAGPPRGLLAAAIDAKHGQVFIQAVGPGGRSIIPASLVSIRDAVRFLGSGPVTLGGSGVRLPRVGSVGARGRGARRRRSPKSPISPGWRGSVPSPTRRRRFPSPSTCAAPTQGPSTERGSRVDESDPLA